MDVKELNIIFAVMISSKEHNKEDNKVEATQSIIVGNRVPKDYFLTQGSGESNITIHSGSFHLALKEAGIEMSNIMTYSSILPGIATEVEKPTYIQHGCVMETIMACASGEKGEELSAGIIYGWLYNRETDERLGGLVCEHEGKFDLNELNNKLDDSLNELYYNGFESQYRMEGINRITNNIIPEKKYGTALVGICFTSYQIPVLQ